MNRRGKSFWGLLVFALLLGSTLTMTGCDIMDSLAGSVVDIEDPGNPDRDNPLDKQGDNYAKPEIELLATYPGTSNEIPASTAIDTPAVDFSWAGKPDSLADRMQFRYRMDGGAWTNWQDGSGSASYTYLDDRSYTFDVEVKYASDSEAQSSASSEVAIDAIKGPAVTYWPRSEETVSALDTIEVEVYMDEVQNVAGVKSVLSYDPSLLKVESIEGYTSQGLLTQNGGSVLFLDGPNQATNEYVLNFVTLDGSPNEVSGSGPIANVKFVVLDGASGSTTIGFQSNSTTRTADNIDSPIQRFVTKHISIN
jgi:hypothetical protein